MSSTAWQCLPSGSWTALLLSAPRPSQAQRHLLPPPSPAGTRSPTALRPAAAVLRFWHLFSRQQSCKPNLGCSGGGGGEWRRGNRRQKTQGIAPAPEMLWNRLIFHVILYPCFITSLTEIPAPSFPKVAMGATHAAVLLCVLSPSGCRPCRWCCQGMALQSRTCVGAASWPSAHTC